MTIEVSLYEMFPADWVKEAAGGKDIATLYSARWDGYYGIERTFETLMDVYQSQALDPPCQQGQINGTMEGLTDDR